MTDINALKAVNAQRWKAMHTNPSLSVALDAVAKRLVDSAAKAHYVQVGFDTTVPWYVIAVIHERESSQSWTSSLAQGDPWNKESIHKPIGIGPFQSWADAAEYALKHCAPFAANNRDWTIGGTLTLLEEYNGLGYAMHNMPSPYIWASTDQYKTGKFIADGNFDPDAIDHQLGCAALLSRMVLADSTIHSGLTA